MKGASLARRVTVVAVACVAVANLIAAPSSAGETQKIETKVDAQYDFNQNEVSGDVDAKKDCDEDRTAKLFHIDGQTGQKTAAGSDRTNNRGGYSIQSSVVPVLGDTWLIVILIETIAIYRCQAARLRIAA